MNWKQAFFSLAEHTEQALPGVTIRKAKRGELFSSLGVFLPDTGEIIYNPRSSTWRSRVMTLAHELGHLRDLLKNYDGDPNALFDEDEPVVERKAYLYGWEILRRAKTTISKKQWRRFHRDRLGQIKEYYYLKSRSK